MKQLLDLLKRHRKPTAGPPELLSVHIPKTAGTSFRLQLKAVYGEAAVTRLDMPLRTGKVRVEEAPYRGEQLPSARVLHGHFRPADLLARFPEAAGVPVITWVRDPVERVISNYFYLEKRLREILDEEGRGVNILSKLQRSLLEYARADINRNRQAKFLEGMPLEEFAFVGIQEDYGEEVRELSRLLGWAEVPEVRVNVTGRSKPPVSPGVREEIARMNAEDIALYQRALHLRRRRNKPSSSTTWRLISMHVPKTAGTSFYAQLQRSYGDRLAPRVRRRDVATLPLLARPPLEVLHGHFHYGEAAELPGAKEARWITWVRDPVERVISNYRFFLAGLRDPRRNPELAEANAHRAEESLLTYARRSENRNVMHRFLDGADLDAFYFVGLQEHYATDLRRLGDLLGWPDITVAHANPADPDDRRPEFDDPAVRQQILAWNRLDAALYERALARRQKETGG